MRKAARGLGRPGPNGAPGQRDSGRSEHGPGWLFVQLGGLSGRCWLVLDRVGRPGATFRCEGDVDPPFALGGPFQKRCRSTMGDSRVVARSRGPGVPHSGLGIAFAEGAAHMGLRGPGGL
jgi:hypothetical protein